MGLVVLAVGWACVAWGEWKLRRRFGAVILICRRFAGWARCWAQERSYPTRTGSVCMDNRDRVFLVAIIEGLLLSAPHLPHTHLDSANPRCCFNRRQFAIAMYVPRTGHVLLPSDSPGGPKLLAPPSSGLSTVVPSGRVPPSTNVHNLSNAAPCLAGTALRPVYITWPVYSNLPSSPTSRIRPIIAQPSHSRGSAPRPLATGFGRCPASGWTRGG